MPDANSVLLAGPWSHRDYSANGVRLHVAEAGAGPLLLLLHGFPQFWWCWRHQLTALSERGFRVVAPDLRGYGASDKPPRGYDAATSAADVAGLVRSLGERDALIVGHGWGGLLAWSVGALHPRVVRKLAVLSMPHPRRLRAASFGSWRQFRAAGPMLGFQLPRYPERRLTDNGGAYVAELMRTWAGPAWRDTTDFDAAVARYRDAIQIPQAAYGSLEYYRWALRSLPRADGRRYIRAMAAPVTAPTLHLHGAEDLFLLPATAAGSGRYVAAAYRWRLLDGVGHFPHEEAPEQVTAELLAWAGAST
ncbi:MAG: alpha/beta fold hydrolase [Geodermatophilaceae bacterium]